MKHKMKRAVALICATIMAVSGCLVEGVLMSKASETGTSTGPVIKFNNPGIGVNVGDTIDLSQYGVEFADGVVTPAANVTWQSSGKIYEVPFASPAIPAIAGEKINLSEYQVQFEENGDFLTVETWEGVELENNTFTPEKGVYQLSATANGKSKAIYVVAKNQEDTEYVLYYNDLSSNKTGHEQNGDYDVFYSKNDFVNVNDEELSTPNWMTIIRTKAANTHYTLGSGMLNVNRYSQTASEYSSLSAHLMLPTWLNVFGDYQVKVKGYVTTKFDDYFVGIDLRAQHEQNLDIGTGPTTTNSKGGYLHNNYLVYIGKQTTDKEQVVGTNYVYSYDNKMKNGDYKSTASATTLVMTDAENMFTLQATMQGNSLSVLAEQGGNTTDIATSTAMSDYRTGRIGIFAYHAITYFDEVQVNLVVQKLNSKDQTGVSITSFTPDAKGVYALTAKTGDTTKTIYVIAKNPEDTEYVMWENNFDTATDAPYYDMGTLNDYDGFGRLYGSGSYAVNEETGKLEVDTGSSRTHLRFPSWIGDFGNYAVQMSENTLAVVDATKQIGLFARGGESRNYTPNYSVLLRYKGYGSDSIAFRVRNEWMDNDDSADAKLSYQQPMVWGKVLNRETVKPDNQYIHELFVQDDLVEYKINGITRLYDVREREFKTGHVGVLIEGGITIHLDSVRVLFVPDVSAPEGPTSASYSRTTSTPGMADGKVTVKLSEGNSARDILCYWGNNGQELEGYTHFGKTVVEAGATSVTVDLGKNIMVPQGATELLVYTENHVGRSSEYVVIPLSSGVTPLQTGKEIMSFQVVSDMHITTKTDGYASLNFEKFLTDLTTNDPDSVGIFVGGDLVDKGNQEEYNTFNTIWNGVETATGKTLPSMHAVIGNHEFWTEKTYEGTVALFNANTGRKDAKTLYYAEEVNGYHFIYLASGKLTAASNTSHTNAELGDVQLAWFANEMQKRAEDGKPIFVFLHQPLQDTVTGAGSDSVKDHEEVKSILKDYPQTFFFTSHSHMNLNTPGTMVSSEDGICNMFNTSAISYLMNTHYTDKTITSDGAEAYYVEVYEDKVLVRGKDVTTNKWMPSAQFVVSFVEETSGGFEAELNSKNVAYLNEAFEVYKFSKPSTKEATYATIGPVNASDLDSASYEGKYSYFTAASNYGSKSKGGLKPGSASGSGYTLLTYNKTSMKAFEAEYTFYAGGDNTKPVGLIFGGQLGELPFSLDNKANDKGVGLYMDIEGNVYVYGAIDPDGVTHSTKIENGQSTVMNIEKNVTDNSRIAGVANVKISAVSGAELYPNGLNKTAVTTITEETESQTVCVKVTDGYLTVYAKGYHNRAVVIPLTDKYEGGYVSLFGTTDQGGAFKSFNVTPVEVWDTDITYALKGYTVGYLDDAFDVYQYDMPSTNAKTAAKAGPAEPSDGNPDKSGYSYFTNRKLTSGATGYNEYGLKATSVPGGNGNGLTTLTYTTETMKSFKAEYDFFPGKTASVYGLAMGVGSDGKFPVSFDGKNTNDKGIVVYMTKDGNLYIAGAIDTSKITNPANKTITTNVEEGFVAGAANFMVAGMTDAGMSYSGYEMTPDTPYFTVCVEVNDEILTVYEKNHPQYAVSVQLSRADTTMAENYYESNYVALIANTAESGSFRGFRLTKLDNHYFRRTTLNELEQHFDSFIFNETTGEVVQGTPATQWNKIQDNQSPSNLGLKPVSKKSALGGIAALSLKNTTVRNFESRTEFYGSHVNFGIMVAPRGEHSTNENGVLVLVSGSGSIVVEGALDGSTGKWTGEGEGSFGTNKVSSPAITDYNHASSTSNRTVLFVTVEDGVLTAHLEDKDGNVFPGKLSVKLTGNYEGGAISLVSRGRDQGGFWSFDVNTLDAQPKARTAFPFDVNLDGEFVKVEVSTDATYSKLVGDFKYDASKFDFVSAEVSDAVVNAAAIEATEGTIPLTMFVNKNGGNNKLVTLYFKELVDTLDFAGFYVDEYDVLTSGGISVTRVDSSVDVANDYNTDKKIDVLDVVRGKKNSTDVSTVRDLLVGKTVYNASTDGAVIINENVVVNAGDTLGTEGTTTIYQNCEVDFSNFTAATDVQLVGSIVFDNVTVKGADQANVFANGYEFKVNENSTFEAKLRRLYGGKYGEQTFTTNLKLLGGQYTYIYAGASSAKVLGDTHITLGGNAEADRVLGGGYQGEILGNTYVTIQDSASITEAYGGGYQNATVQGNCCVNFLGGNVRNLYGGGRQADVNGNTYVVVGGNANADIDVADHDNLTHRVYGGGDGSANTAIVKGNVYVTVQDSARAHVVYGGGYGSKSTVEGTCNVDINGGYVMGYFGGSREKGVVYGTNITMTAGTTEQIFGGCDRYSMTGDATVTVLGGQVQRRIYGGCYNDYDNDNEKWLTSHGVNGQVNVIIGKDANLSFDLKVSVLGGMAKVKADNSLMAASRYSGEIENETGVLIFLDGAYADNSGKIGYHSDSLVGLQDKFTTRYYDYLVKATTGGTVTADENALCITPQDGKSVTVSDGSSVVYSASEKGNYTLPALEDNAQKTLNVNFQ